MRYFVFSDIHGNLEALEAVLEVLNEENDCIPICLGDIVGYGPNPHECIQAIRDRNILSIVGNHDRAAIDEVDISYFNPYAKEAVLWTRSILKDSDTDFLRSLPVVRTFGNMTLVHATPCDPHSWNYLFTLFDAQNNFKCFNTQLCFIGHSHSPIIIVQKHSGECWVHPHTVIGVQHDLRFIVNAGSVGQPRDGNPDAAYMIYDDQEGTIEIHRVAYAMRKTQEKMKRHGLPDYLIERLELGR
ncbi:metallophosphoesterase family protein [bacterium]|nr:metallophosphoesterase family protein [candidate division CSSED10-310 bacterium]